MSYGTITTYKTDVARVEKIRQLESHIISLAEAIKDARQFDMPHEGMSEKMERLKSEMWSETRKLLYPKEYLNQ